MKWITVNHPSTSIQRLQLTDGHSTKVVLKYNHLQQSARISSEEKQRLFFIEKTGGIWNHKFVFKNEYGVVVGWYTFEKSYNHSGNIEIGGKKYHYAIRHKPSSELVIYEHDISLPLVVCDLALPPTDQNNSSEITDQEFDACLLLGSCWYFFLSGEEPVFEYSSNLSVV